MTLLQAAVLGLVQGLTEFLPVSSSGHLALVPPLLGWEPHPAAFDAFLHLGTLAAVVVALRDDVGRILTGLWKGDSLGRVGWLIAIGTVPTLLVGFLMSEVIGLDLRSPAIVVTALAVWGALLWVSDRRVRPEAVDDIRKLSWKQAIVAALFQVFALIPGTSRSGATITGGLLMGLSRETAARFSFLLGIPAILAAGILSTAQMAKGSSVDLAPAFVGFVVSFVAGAFAIRWLLKLMKTATYAPFALYRVALALVAAFALLS